MTNEQIQDREYTRIIETLEHIAQPEVMELVKELEICIEAKNMAREIESLKSDYRVSKEGI